MAAKQQQNLKNFLEKYKSELTKQIKQSSPQQIKARILTQDQSDSAASLIANGQLVAFPTQTVYGLGANAFNEEALKNIYVTKKRPLTDPIIVHVLDASQADKLVIMKEKQRKIFQILTKQFWPGPLTVILQANLDLLPLIVTAQTGFVGVRAPKHPFARKLIEKSNVPIGAPSANLFSHVSPTQPVHVFNDFFNCQISIVDGKRCEFGVESTVIKLLNDELHVFREGSLSVKHLQNFLKKVLPEKQLPKVMVLKRVENKHTNMEAPGQLLKHYAPYLPCYYLQDPHLSKNFKNSSSSHVFQLSKAAFISFDSKKFEAHKSQAKHYFQVGKNITQQKQQEKCEEDELFCSKQQKQRMRQIYYLLRKCENLQVDAIIIGWSDAKEGTVWDKIFRSTQGQSVRPTQ